MSTTSMEDVAQAVGSSALRFFPLYIIKDREYTRELLQSEVLKVCIACTCQVGSAAALDGQSRGNFWATKPPKLLKHPELRWCPGQPCLNDSQNSFTPAVCLGRGVRPRSTNVGFCCCCTCLFQHTLLLCSGFNLHRAYGGTSSGRDELRGVLDEETGHQLIWGLQQNPHLFAAAKHVTTCSAIP